MKEIDKLTFEEALQELEEIVHRLEEEKINLEESISLYERGNILKLYCDKKLRTARMKVEQVTVGDSDNANIQEKLNKLD